MSQRSHWRRCRPLLAVGSVVGAATIWAPPRAGAATPTLYLNGISCTAATACTAVGGLQVGNTDSMVVERWGGSNWSAQKPPPIAGGASLAGVSCTSATACTAVGDTSDFGLVAESWNGQAWTRQTMSVPPAPPKSVAFQVNAVSCSTYDACTAVGTYQLHSGLLAGFIERRSGASWSAQTPPTQGLLGYPAYLSDVSCGTATSCTAVGGRGGIGGSPGVIEHWNGSAWTVQYSTKINPSYFHSFTAVSCLSANWCTVVGGYGNDVYVSSQVPSAGTWDGKSWTFVTLAPTGAGYGRGVSCAPPGTCAIVESGGLGGWVEMGAGAKWNKYAAGPTALVDVSCVSAVSCTAIGGDRAERWNGTAWLGQTISTP